jgi:hypothetical protein
MSGFSLAMGDPYDGRLIHGIVNHWYLVFSGQSALGTLEMMYPLEGTLSYSDTFFLFGCISSVFQLLGANLYVAFQLTLMLSALAGFLGMHLLLRELLGARWWVCSLGAAFLILAAPMQTVPQNSHLQLFNVWLLPWALLFLVRALKSGSRTQLARRANAAAFGASLALLFFNAFYVPWFCVFYLCLLSFVSAIVYIVRARLTISRRKVDAVIGVEHGRLLDVARSRLPDTWPFAVSFSLFLLPFLLLYLPVLLQRGGHPFALETLPFLPHLVDFLNVSPNNWLWGWLPQRLGVLESAELRYGLPPLTLGLLLFTGGAAILRWTRRGDERSRLLSLLFIALLLAWLLLWRSPVFPLWKLVHTYVPGGTAIRPAFRFNVFLIIPVAAILAATLDGSMSQRSPLLRRGRFVFAVLLPACVLTEQLADIRPGIDVAEMLRRSDVPPPPADAAAFFIVNETGPNSIYTHMDAFTMGQRLGIPTILGYSGVLPQPFIDDSANPDKILRWIRAQEIQTPIYYFDQRKWHGAAKRSTLWRRRRARRNCWPTRHRFKSISCVDGPRTSPGACGPKERGRASPSRCLTGRRLRPQSKYGPSRRCHPRIHSLCRSLTSTARRWKRSSSQSPNPRRNSSMRFLRARRPAMRSGSSSGTTTPGAQPNRLMHGGWVSVCDPSSSGQP